MQSWLVLGLARPHATKPQQPVNLLLVGTDSKTIPTPLLQVTNTPSIWPCVMVEDILAILHVHPLTN
jgi:hypothetical protein